MLRSFQAMYGLDYVALRYFNVYGPRMDVHGVYTEVLIRWMERIADGQPPLILGDGKPDDGLRPRRGHRPGQPPGGRADVTDEVFNIACGTETSLLDWPHALLAVMGADLRLEFGPERAVNGVTRRLADISAAADGLGFKAEVGPRRGPAPPRRLVGRREPAPQATDAADLPHPGHAPVARRGGGARRRRGRPLRLGRPGPPGRGSSSRRSPPRVGAQHGVAVSSCTTGLHLAAARARHRPRRRGRRAVAVLHRHRQRRPLHRRHAGLRRRRPGDRQPHRRDRRRRCAPRGHARSWSCTRPACRPTSTSCTRCATRAASAVLEDAACAAGSTYQGRPVGAGALLAAWSFHPRKLLTTGEGGMLTTDDAERAVRLRRLREHGMSVSAADRHARRTRGPRAVPRDRLQLPDDRHPGRGRPRAAGRWTRSSPVGVSSPRATTSCSPTARPDLCRRPGVRHDELPVVLGLAARRLPGPRNVLAGLAERGISAGAESWPRTSSPPTRVTPRRPAGHRAPSPAVAHPAAVPRPDRVRAGPGRVGRLVDCRVMTACSPLLLVGASGLARETLARGVARSPSAAWDRARLGRRRPDTLRRRDRRPAGARPIRRGARARRRSRRALPGEPRNRTSGRTIVRRLGLAADRYATVVHPAASVASGVEIGAGVVLLAVGAVTAPSAIGAHVVVMPGVAITHDDALGDHVTVGARVRARRWRVRRAGAYLGSGALVRENLTVGELVDGRHGRGGPRDVPPHEVWAGYPRRAALATTYGAAESAATRPRPESRT